MTGEVGKMPDLQISRSDIEQLARKLDSLGSHFTQSEWTLLSAVFALATEAVGATGSAVADPRPPGAGRPAVAAPAASPLASFTPGKDEDDEGLVPDKIGQASLHDLVLRSFTPGQDEASGSDPGSGPGTGPGPDKIGRA
jgi:hypothetical protein